MSTATLELRADSRQVRTATSDLERLNGVGDASTRMVTTLRRGFIALGGAAAVRGATRTIAEFSQEISTVAAISGATESQLKALREETLRLGSTTRFSASEAAAGAQFLARAGFDTDQILGSLNETLTLAQAGSLDLASAADIASNVLTGFRIGAEEAGRAVDVLAFAANRSNTDVRQLGDALSFVAPIASGLGVSLEETTAAIGALSDAGLQGSTAGTGLRRVLSTLESPTAQAARRLAELGVSADEVQISSVGLTAALERLRAAGITTGEALEIFGDRGGPAFEVLSTSISSVREMSQALGEAEGFAQGVADVMDDNLNGALLSVRSATEGFTIALGDLGAESSATQAANALAGGIRSLTENLDSITNVAATLSAVIGARLAGSAATATASFVAAQIQAARYQATLASMAGVSATAAASQLALSRALALVGGPAGVAVLAAFGVYRLSQSYRDGLQAQEDRTQRIMEEHKAQQALNEELRKAGRLFEDTAQATAAGATAMDNYQRSVDAAYAAQIQGMSQSQIQEEFDNVSASLQRAESRLARVSERFGEGTLRYKQAEEAVRALRAQLAALNGVFPNLTTSSEQLSESIQKVRQSLEDQIYELENGERAYELLIATRQAGIALDSEEAAGLAELIDKRNELTEAQREQARVAREQAAAQREEQRTGQEFGQLSGALSVETTSDPQAAALEAQLEERLRLIDEYRMTKEADQEAADQAELAAFESLEMQKTRIAEQEAQSRRQAQLSQLDSTASFFGDVAQLAQNAGKEQFEVYKAAATAQAVIGTYSSAVKAYDALAGIPYVGPALGIAAAATAVAFGLQQVSAIRSQQYTPRAAGGQVLDGRQYLVGERGPELITMRGNGQVTPNSQLTQGAQSSVNQQANITFEIPQTDDNIRRVLADSQDIIFNAVNQALRRQGRTL